MKKICFFMRSPFTLGGEQRVVTILSNYLAKKGYDVYFLLTDKFKKIDYDIYKMDKNIKILFIPGYNRICNRILRKILSTFRYNFKFSFLLQRESYCNIFDEKLLLNEFNKYNFDYVIGVSSDFFSVLGLLKNKLTGTKIIAWEHSTFESYFKTKNHRFYNQEKLLHKILSNFDYYVVQTSDDKEKIRKEFGINCHVIGNPNTIFCNNNAISSLTSKNFIAAGRFDYVKGYDLLIEAFNIFCKKNKEYNLLIIGDGVEKDNYINLIKKYKLEKRISLIDKTTEIEKYYMQSCAYVMSSRWEGWGMVVTEAMQFGLPIVSFDIPSTLEIFGDMECGVLVPKFDVLKLACALEKVIGDNKMKYQKNSLKRVKNFDITIIGEMWLNILK